jgi:hypothetical protein
LQDLRAGGRVAPEGTLSISVNLAGNVPSWKGDANLPLAAGRAAEVASLADAESLLTGLETASGGEPTRMPNAGHASGHGQVSAQAQEPGLPVLSALPVTAQATHGKDSLGMPEDWFESSVLEKKISGAGAIEAADPAQPTRANQQVSSRLDATRMVEGLFAGGVDSGRQIRSNQVDFETVQVQSLAAEVKLGAVFAKTSPEVYRLQGPGIRPDDKLMEEIPLLFAPVPVEPQQTPLRMRFKAVVVNGVLMLGAVLVAILVATLNLKDLPSIEMMELAAAVPFALGALYLIFRWARPRRP